MPLTIKLCNMSCEHMKLSSYNASKPVELVYMPGPQREQVDAPVQQTASQYGGFAFGCASTTKIIGCAYLLKM